MTEGRGRFTQRHHRDVRLASICAARLVAWLNGCGAASLSVATLRKIAPSPLPLLRAVEERARCAPPPSYRSEA